MQKFILTLIVFFSASCSFFGGPNYDLSADSTGLSFDGIDDYIQIDANIIPDSGDFSIAVWGKADAKNTGNRIVLSQNDTTGNPFYFGSTQDSEKGGSIRMNEDWSELKDSGFPIDDNWHYFTIVNDGTIGDSADIIDTSAFFSRWKNDSLCYWRRKNISKSRTILYWDTMEWVRGIFFGNDGWISYLGC